MGFFDRIKQSLTRTKEQFVERLRRSRQARRRAGEAQPAGRPRDHRGARGGADLGGRRRGRHRPDRRRRSRPGGARGESLRTLVKEEIRGILRAADRPVAAAGKPHVVLIVGVNGTGKTTTVGKLARLLKDSGTGADDLRRRHVPRRRGRAARDLGDAGRGRFHPGQGRRRPGRRRVRCAGRRQGARPRRRPGRHRRPTCTPAST